LKGHVSVDPDSEIITNSTVTAGNVADGEAIEDLADELVNHQPEAAAPAEAADGDRPERGEQSEPAKTIYGDCAYGTGSALAWFLANRIDPNVKTQRPQAPNGHFTKDDFIVDLETDTATCPNGVTVPIRWGKTEGQAYFAKNCAGCPLRDQCTSSTNGRGVSVSHYEAELQQNRARQTEPARAADYRATRPKVERKLGHLMRRRHGGRRARVRGQTKVSADFNLLAAAANLARLAVLRLRWEPGIGWAAA